MKNSILLSLILSLSTSQSFAEETADASPAPSPKATSTNGVKTVTLDEVIAEGTPAEALKFDPIVPAMQGETKAKISTGNIAKELQNDLPFHFNSNFKPGNQVGFQGAGANSEETDVNVLGIPINGPQGGGVDLSSFPQYFWNGFSYQIGPSLGAYDPRGVSGSLTLRLWTQDTIGTDSTRLLALHSTRKIQQLAAGKSGSRYSLIGGYTTGHTNGPGFGFSAIPFENENTRISTHLIFADTKSEGFESERYPGFFTAEQRTDRFIPIFQVDRRFSEKTKLKASLFHDFNFIHYADTRSGLKHVSRIHQTGFESALVHKDTRMGLSLRNTTYTRSTFPKIPTEQIINLQATQSLNLSGIKFEPTLGGNAVTRKGFFPLATFGFRHDSEDGAGKFLRFGYHRRFPSLIDRYYSASFGPTTRVIPNPGLQPGSIRSIEAGTDYKSGDYRTQLTAFFRDYKHARFTKVTVAGAVSNYQVVNEGDAYTVGFIRSQDYTASSFLDIGTRLTYQYSKVSALAKGFPYSPDWIGILKFDIHNPGNDYGLEMTQKASTKYIVYSDSSNTPTTEAGYYYMDLIGRARLTDNLTFNVGVENVFDNKIEFRSGSPDQGRVYTLSAVGSF